MSFILCHSGEQRYLLALSSNGCMLWVLFGFCFFINAMCLKCFFAPDLLDGNFTSSYFPRCKMNEKVFFEQDHP